MSLIPAGLSPWEGHPGWGGHSGQGFSPPGRQAPCEYLLEQNSWAMA